MLQQFNVGDLIKENYEHSSGIGIVLNVDTFLESSISHSYTLLTCLWTAGTCMVYDPHMSSRSCYIYTETSVSVHTITGSECPRFSKIFDDIKSQKD